MALSKSLLKAQIPVSCVCETDLKVSHFCNDCQIYLCDGCKRAHFKVPATKDHRVIHIKDIGENKPIISAFNIGFKIIRKYTVDMMHIHDVSVSPDGSLWIGDGISETVQHVKVTGDSITTMSTFNIKPFCLAISPSGSPFIIAGGSTLKIINELTGQTMNSKFSINPWILSSVHTTKDGHVIVGGHDGKKGIVIVMDRNGEHLSKYEKDKDVQLFSYPDQIVMTNNRNLFIIDGPPEQRSSRLVVIKPGSGDIMFYNGNDDITTKHKPFNPVSVLVTPSDNVLLVNHNTTYLYIMNNEGAFITCFDLADIGVDLPYSIGLSPTGNIYVGMANLTSAPKDAKSTLYELEYSGV